MDGNEAGKTLPQIKPSKNYKKSSHSKIKIALPESANDFGEMKNEDLEYWRMKNENTYLNQKRVSFL